MVSYSTSPAFEVPKGSDQSNTTALLQTCFRQVEYAGVIAGAQNQVGAQKVIDFMLSKQVQTALPTAMYGVVLLMAAIAYWILQQRIIAVEGHDSLLARATGSDFKGRLSPLFYSAGIALAFVQPWLSCALYVLVALAWLVPDRRIESRIDGQ